MFLAAGIVVAVVRRRDRANIVSVSSFVEMRSAVFRWVTCAGCL